MDAMADNNNTPPAPATGLLLTGGGARAAYQVGVLEAIADIRIACGAQHEGSPFGIITGTSAGAINAAALATGADDFDGTVRRVVGIWRNFKAQQVYRADSLSVMRTGARWLTLLSLGWLLNKWRRFPPKSLLDNRPLLDLLGAVVQLDRLPQLIAQGHLQALAVTASSYSSGEHVTFFQGHAHLTPWVRQQRLSVHDRITFDHLLASSAIPFIFPSVPLPINGHMEYFGDGSMRQSAPIAPAIHLGATRVLVIGAGRMTEPKDEAALNTHNAYPSLAQIAGHALSNIFLDALAVDVERLRRINATLALIPPAALASSPLRPVDLLVIAPSQRLDAAAARHVDALPHAVRTLLSGLGVSSKAKDVKGAALASYLLFESSYTTELLELGYADAMAQAHEVRRFFGWGEPQGKTRLPWPDDATGVVAPT